MTAASPRAARTVKGKKHASRKEDKKEEKTVRASLAVAETEDLITLGAASWDASFRDRLHYDRLKLLTDAVTAWRSNPIARRIIEITTEFVVGDGFSFQCPAQLEDVLREFWDHPLNNLDEQLPEWADEAWRTGDLFLLLSVDAGGRLYARALPSESIGVIETSANDYRQETLYRRDSQDENPWPAFSLSKSDFGFGEGRGGTVLHFPLNRAVGASFGESDLTPVLHWIGLYRQWLEDRSRLNYFRQMFSFTLQRPFASNAQKESYIRTFISRLPKQSGGVLALDPEETLGVLNPNLSSFEAEADGLAIKRMIAAGVGLPMHYLAEPESSTRTTAEAAGTPTFKRFRRRQQYLVNVVKTLLQTVAAVRLKADPGIASISRPAPARTVPSAQPAGDPKIRILFPDITEKDNASLAIAVQRVVTAFAPLYNAKLIEPKEFIRLVYRFVAEPMPENMGAFAPLNVRGGASRLPNADPSDPKKDEPDPP